MICDAAISDPDAQELNRYVVVELDDSPVRDLVEYADSVAGVIRVIRRAGNVVQTDGGKPVRATLNGRVSIGLKSHAPVEVKARYEAACQADNQEPIYFAD